ncbi:ribokinase [Dyadobacter bucti]|uniref:ribokinase n=1 Tax=Dyadobacter bucti TaxID=2572203 RepID=UPI001109E666|nr:ribokinase [Dyadobacter bucti]
MIYVVGSSNTDMVVKSHKLPMPGETVMGGNFLMNPGGKGANQALSASRLGGKVNFICKVGNDLFGKQALQQFKREKIGTDFIVTDALLPSGVALINVDHDGENCISVAPGANSSLKPSEVILAFEDLTPSDILLIQLEIPLETVIFSIKTAFEKNVKVILNPAPAQYLPDDVLQCLYLITPNETEAELLTGIRVVNDETAEQASSILVAKGCRNVIITLGSKGAFLYTENIRKVIPAPAVTAVDTTAAGDCFNGALAVGLSEGMALDEAVSFACKVAAISVTRMGAQSSIPLRKEVDQLPLLNNINPLTNL